LSASCGIKTAIRRVSSPLMSVVVLFEGDLIGKMEGRSVTPRVKTGRPRPGTRRRGGCQNDDAVRAQCAKEASGGTEDVARATPKERVVVGGGVFHQGVLEDEGAFEREQVGVGDVEDDELGSEEQTAELLDGHRFRVGSGVFGFGDWAKTARKSFSSRRASSQSAATAIARQAASIEAIEKHESRGRPTLATALVRAT
jgi:hypothetical protein